MLRYPIIAAWIASLLPLFGCGIAEDSRGEREATFDQVWQHLAENFYDETFNGRDWEALANAYRPRALYAPTDKAFYAELNGMLFELGVSHIGVIPDDHPEWIGAPSSFAGGEVGLDIRVIEGRIVVVDRDAKLGEQAPALRPGTIVTKLNGRSIEDFVEEVRQPPVSTIPELIAVTERAARELYAEPGSDVAISYLGPDGHEYEANLTAYKRGSAITLLEGVPPVYADFESRVIDDKIGYIFFNSFHPALLDQILATISSFDALPALIIDLRGNVGGDFNVRRAIAEHLIQERSLVWRYRGRRGIDNVVLESHEDSFDGEVVFLVDELSASSAEELSGAMQALGRATVVGSQTAGLVLVGDVLRLDIGATLIYPIAETSFISGYVPEGRGIVPDEIVPWDRDSLLEGRDHQLEVALQIALAE